MQAGNWQFKPRLVPALVTLVVFPLLLSLGFWQLDRAEQKRTLHAEFMQHRELPSLDLNRQKPGQLTGRDILWRKVNLRGEFTGKHTLLLDNQVHHGEAGYFVFMPFQLQSPQITVLVNRGWIPAGPDRQQLPAIDTPEGEVRLLGVMKEVPSTGIMLSDDVIEELHPGAYRLQKLQVKKMEQQLGMELLPWVIRLLPESAHGFTREWELPGSDEAKHLGYAFQWFALAATLLVIFIVVNTKRAGGSDA